MPASFNALRDRLRILTPALYSATPAQAEPMRSAGLRFAADGSVAWDEIWQSFCDLALAGGPPHKGSLLLPGTARDIASHPGPYSHVTTEICRGIGLTTGLFAEPAASPDSLGWVSISCTSTAMASWLVRAVTIENVAARASGSTLDLPAAPTFRIDKQIKNVITVIAKTTHYWQHHIPASQQWSIAGLFAETETAHPLLQPDFTTSPAHHTRIAATLQDRTSLPVLPLQYAGWLGLAMPSAAIAIDRARLLIAANILSRREETTLFLPLNPATDPDGHFLLDQAATTLSAHPCL